MCASGVRAAWSEERPASRGESRWGSGLARLVRGRASGVDSFRGGGDIGPSIEGWGCVGGVGIGVGAAGDRRRGPRGEKEAR